jgi:single-strand DNA-binding protein
MNKAILTGWLTDDVVLKTVPSGKAVCTFTLAVHKRQKKSEAIFVPIVTWDAVAQSCTKYLKKV